MPSGASTPLLMESASARANLEVVDLSGEGAILMGAGRCGSTSGSNFGSCIQTCWANWCRASPSGSKLEGEVLSPKVAPVFTTQNPLFYVYGKSSWSNSA